MGKGFIFVRSNLKKSKGQTVAIAVLICLAALMLNLWLMLAMDYKANFNRYHEKLNAEHVTYVVEGNGEELKDFIKTTLDGDERTSQYTLDNVLLTSGSFDYNGGTITCSIVFMEKEQALDKEVGTPEIVEEGDLSSGIYLPMLYKTGETEVGSEITITVANRKYNFTVCGFINSVMAGSHNCGMAEILITQDEYARLEGAANVYQSTLCSIRIKDRAEASAYRVMLHNKVSGEYPELLIVGNDYEMVATSRYVSQTIVSAIISAMAFLVLLIALIVIASNIINYIQENMKKLGTLKAMGYTGSQIISYMVLQFLAIAALSALLGIALSYAVFPAVSNMMVAQTGIPYKIRFLIVPIILSLAIPAAVVALVTFLASYRIKRIEPIVALRQGAQTRKVRRNPVPLQKTKVPVNTALALKTTLSGVKNNVTVAITMIVLSFLLAFTGLMVRNIIVDSKPFMDLVVGEYADSGITVKVEDEDKFVAAMEEDDRVEKIYLYHSEEVKHGEEKLVVTMSEDFSAMNNDSICYEGRLPESETEIAIGGRYAKEQNLHIGDKIKVSAKGNEAEFEICGFNQLSNNLGRDCQMTREGYERMASLTQTMYYLNLKDGVDAEEFNDDVGKSFELIVAIDIANVLEASSGVYISLMTIITVAIIILSIIIVAFVLYLLVRTLLANKKRDYGVLKGLGYTTKQLVLQTAISFLPALLLSTVIGVILGCVIVNPFISTFLAGMGIVKCSLKVPVGLIIGLGAGLVAISFGIACLLSTRVKNITTKELLMGE